MLTDICNAVSETKEELEYAIELLDAIIKYPEPDALDRLLQEADLRRINFIMLCAVDRMTNILQ